MRYQITLHHNFSYGSGIYRGRRAGFLLNNEMDDFADAPAGVPRYV